MHPLEFDELRHLIVERGEEWKTLDENELKATIRAFIDETGAAPLTEAQQEELNLIYQIIRKATPKEH